MKTHWKKNFNYDYLGSYSLPDGKEVTLTIAKTATEKVIGANGKKEDCFVVYFKEADKPMILNRTNSKTISKLYGTPYVEDWIGKRVTIGVDIVNAFGEQTEALRIRMVKPQPAQVVSYIEQEKKLRNCTTLAELQSIYTGLTPDEKAGTLTVKDEMKQKLSTQ
jgi:hypothetical protein